MMTLDEAVQAWTSNSDELTERYRDLLLEMENCPGILRLTMALRESRSPSEAVLLGLKIGLLLGMEMEKKH